MEPQQNEVKSIIEPLKNATPLSKYLAMGLFIILPFIGGWIGYVYAPEKVVEVEKVIIKEIPVEAVQSQEMGGNLELTNQYKKYRNDELHIEFEYPSQWLLSEYESGSTSPSYTGKQVIISPSNISSGPMDSAIELSILEISRFGANYDSVEDILLGKNSSSKAFVANPTAVTIAGFNGVTYTTGAEGSSYKMAMFENDGLAYLISMQESDYETDVFNDFLQTLKLTN